MSENTINNSVDDTCPHTKHVDGKSHGWLFDGDDPYIVCDWCKERRDAITGCVIHPHVPSVADIPSDELLKRAVRGARSNYYRKGVKHQRWVAVKDLFGLGSTYAHQLCIRFGLDPEEMVKR